MISFLFWNLNGRPLQRRVANIVREHEVDVVVLAECDASSHVWLEAINEAQQCDYNEGIRLLETIAVYTRLSQRTLEENPELRLSAHQLFLPSGDDILCVATHLPSKLYWRDASQSHLCTQLAARIGRLEEQLGHSRTILVGDLNMNPFEPGLVSSYGLHATMARQVAERQTRTVLGQDYPFFYNPMWGYFGDALDGPPGTYYYSRAEPVNYFWNIFDQVLLRPSLLGRFENNRLRILDSDGASSLLTTQGLPDSVGASDHLPIVFAFHL